MKNQLLSIFLAAATAVSALAMPARRGFFKATDTAGQTIAVQRTGNAFTRGYVDSEGRKLVRLADGAFALATSPEARAAKARRSAPRRVPGQIGTFPGTTFPAKGKQKAIVVLVEFKDQKFLLGDHAHDYFNDLLNKDDFSEYGATGGVHKYFMDSSNGMFDCQFDLFGPVTLKNNLKYYGENDNDDQDMHPEEMVIEACRALDATVDFAEYDRDNDGVIDNVYVIYAGRGEASDVTGEHPELVWPHSWNVGDMGLKFDGKLLDSYGCSNEWEDIYELSGWNDIEVVGQNPDGIGTFVHEFSHILGLPDLYKTVEDNDEAYVTPGEWSVLDYGPYNNNGRTPPAYSSFERNALGWMDLTELTADSGDVTLEELNASNSALCITNPVNSGEFFLLESRARTGWDAYLPADGMLVWHVDYDADTWQGNSVNNNKRHQYVDLVEADGIADKTYRDGGDAYPGTKKVTTFRPRWWNNSYAGINITGIAANSGTVTFNAASATSSTPGGDNETGDFLTVADVLNSNPSGDVVTVRGYIVGYVTGGNFHSGAHFTAQKEGGIKEMTNTNIILADSPDETDSYSCIPVQLPSGSVRDDLNLKSHPENLGRRVELTGTHSNYFSEPGLRSVSAYRFIEATDGITSIEAGATAPQGIYNLQGRRVSNLSAPGIYIVNGRKVIIR